MIFAAFFSLAAKRFELGKRLEFRLFARSARVVQKAIEAAARVDRHALPDSGIATVPVLRIIAHAYDVSFLGTAAWIEQVGAALRGTATAIPRTAAALLGG